MPSTRTMKQNGTLDVRDLERMHGEIVALEDRLRAARKLVSKWDRLAMQHARRATEPSRDGVGKMRNVAQAGVYRDCITDLRVVLGEWDGS